MKTLLVAAVLFCATSVHAQEGYLEMLRSDLRADKVAIITQAMQFTQEQADAFWPVYREYDLEMTKLNDMRVALLQDYAANYGNMTDEKAGEIIAKSIEFQQKRLDLRKTYFKKFEKVIPTAMAAKFLQVDHQIGLLIDLQIAANLPLIQPISGD
jgi:hypothetical protein